MKEKDERWDAEEEKKEDSIKMSKNEGYQGS